MTNPLKVHTLPVTLSNCTISGNSATTAAAASINQGSMTLTNCSVSGNLASQRRRHRQLRRRSPSPILPSPAIRAYTSGGGLYELRRLYHVRRLLPAGTVTLSNSTINGNQATESGGGLYNGGTMTVNNSTVAGNSAAGTSGGGIYNSPYGTLSLTNATIAYNYSGQNGGGLLNAGTTTMTNTIVALNTDGLDQTPGDADDIYTTGGTTTATYSLIGYSSNSGVTSAGGNILNPGTVGLSTLGNNGGLTETIALLSGSPALDAGGGSFLSADQHGNSRGETPDIGAYQLSSGAADSLSLSVSGSNLVATLTFSGSDGSLSGESASFSDTATNYQYPPGGFPTTNYNLGTVDWTEVNAETYTATLPLTTLAPFESTWGNEEAAA